ncbi:MAG: YCF48-related protein [Burkholderiales bacterium]|nr:YCF48-related protein [Burkholderiales bacterium]
MKTSRLTSFRNGILLAIFMLLLSACSVIGQLIPSSNPSVVNDYVALTSNGNIFVSKTGESWESITTLKSSYWNSLTYQHDKFIAFGVNGKIYYSYDSLDWQLVSENNDPRVWLYDVEYKNGVYIGVGTGGLILSATSMKDPNPLMIHTGIHNWLSSICYSNKQFIIVGSHGVILSSTNGRTWTKQVSPTTNWLKFVESYNGVIFAGGAKGSIISSSDGFSWQTLNTPVKDWLYSIAYGNDNYVVVGENSIVLTSTDGINWDQAENNLPKDSIIKSVIFADGEFWASLDKGQIAHSKDAKNWSLIQLSSKSDVVSIAHYSH